MLLVIVILPMMPNFYWLMNYCRITEMFRGPDFITLQKLLVAIFYSPPEDDCGH
jgi:hypothetical protein